ncbi:hypothetical protein A3860_39395 [Niastella vici]|uniref:Methyltransferase type 11 n=1 Tax=Niastella vici TaxID=1703345 RepID=A0A1V9FK36_9BACT|nr:methyltransferase domain-containing protein [Niastella vici]OQP58718.1 hypothetical protein A3860_39395 [Niastella vici]
MTFLDKYLQQKRIKMAAKYIPSGSTVLDIGCHQGELFRALGKKLHYGWGIDPLLQQEVSTGNFSLVKGFFPDDWRTAAKVNCICMLAVLEHIPLLLQQQIAVTCAQLLTQDGLIIITVPSPKTDTLLAILKRLRLIKGMSLEEHYGFDPNSIPAVFGQAGFTLLAHRKFQLGFNNVYLLKKTF